MTESEFNKILETRLEKMRRVLTAKAGEYAATDDRLYNFKRAGEILQCTPEQALLGMAMKHFVSVLDMIQKPNVLRMNAYDEKIGDAINYLFLLETLIIERLTYADTNTLGNSVHGPIEECEIPF